MGNYLVLRATGHPGACLEELSGRESFFVTSGLKATFVRRNKSDGLPLPRATPQ